MSRRLPILFLLVAFLTTACDSATSPQNDAGVISDAGTDAGDNSDAGTDGFDTCEGDCRNSAITMQVGANQRELPLAYFGYSAPATVESNRWELWIELNSGQHPGCPSEEAPVPNQIVNVFGLAVPTDGKPQTEEGGAGAVLIDFEGALTQEWVYNATKLTVTPVAAKLCPGCAQDGGVSGEHFVAFEVDGTFEDGTLKGHGYATHCESLDTLQ